MNNLWTLMVIRVQNKINTRKKKKNRGNRSFFIFSSYLCPCYLSEVAVMLIVLSRACGQGATY